MKIVLFILLGLVGLLGLVALVLYIAGSQMPREHRAQRSVILTASRATVWSAITDYAAIPSWWPMVKAVRVEKLADGTELTWNTDSHGNEVPYRTSESRVNERLVRVIASDQLAFGGTWTFDLADASGGGTQLTITEDGYVNPPIFRAMAKWVFGLDTTMRDYLANLEKHLATKSNPATSSIAKP
jgi:uncharacterized protein YndB with AHSA1/START domain